MSDITTNLKLTDMETCYKVFRREVLQGVEIKSNRFGFEPEITAKIAKGSWRIYEVPISYAGRTYEEGRKLPGKMACRRCGASSDLSLKIREMAAGRFVRASGNIPRTCGLV